VISRFVRPTERGGKKKKEEKWYNVLRQKKASAHTQVPGKGTTDDQRGKCDGERNVVGTIPKSGQKVVAEKRQGSGAGDESAG